MKRFKDKNTGVPQEKMEAASKSQNEGEWSQPKEVDTLTMAFPAGVVGTLLPPKEVIPQEFWYGHTYWNRMASRWFFRGISRSEFTAKDGIDSAKAFRQLHACLGSFEPKHEHKEAGVAYLMSLWFVAP